MGSAPFVLVSLVGAALLQAAASRNSAMFHRAADDGDAPFSRVSVEAPPDVLQDATRPVDDLRAKARRTEPSAATGPTEFSRASVESGSRTYNAPAVTQYLSPAAPSPLTYYGAASGVSPHETGTPVAYGDGPGDGEDGVLPLRSAVEAIPERPSLYVRNRIGRYFRSRTKSTASHKHLIRWR